GPAGVAGVGERVGAAVAGDAAAQAAGPLDRERVVAGATDQVFDAGEAADEAGDASGVAPSDVEAVTRVVAGDAVRAAVTVKRPRQAPGADQQSVVAGAAGQVLDVAEGAAQDGAHRAGVGPGQREGAAGAVAGQRVGAAAAVDVARQGAAVVEEEAVAAG